MKKISLIFCVGLLLSCSEDDKEPDPCECYQIHYSTRWGGFEYVRDSITTSIIIEDCQSQYFQSIDMRSDSLIDQFGRKRYKSIKTTTHCPY